MPNLRPRPGGARDRKPGLRPGPAATNGGEVITVFAPKGGAGKTVTAINLGVALSGSGSGPVCVLDLDLACGQVAISLGIDPERTITEGLSMAGRMDQFGAGLLLTPFRPGLELLLPPLVPGDEERIPAALIGELLSVLRGMFAYVVVDCPAALTEHVLTAMDAADHHVLITAPEVPSLKNLRVATDTMDLLSYPRGIRSVVLNRCDSRVGVATGDIETAARCEIAARVPSSKAVPLSMNQAVPITLSKPRHPVSRAFTTLAQRIGSAPPRERQPLPRRPASQGAATSALRTIPSPVTRDREPGLTAGKA